MKRYIDYYNEISSDELRKGLLSQGLFADKLPPIFSSEKFFSYCDSKGFPIFQNGQRDYIRYSTMRNTNYSRVLGIPNPLAYSNLCNILSQYWDDIRLSLDGHTQNQTFCNSQIHLRKQKNSERLFEMNTPYSERDKDLECFLPTLPIAKRYRVTADISSCFPSIYTHCISWALVDKQTAKAKKTNKNEWFNKIDLYTRNMKFGETNGLLIGPHTSNLLSEIVLSCVDEELCTKYSYYRTIDDFTCFVSTEDEANKFVVDLSSSLEKYQLALNAKKTKIEKLPLCDCGEWVNALNGFHIGCEKESVGRTIFTYLRLVSFLDLSTKLANDTNNSAVYTYAIKVISSCFLGKKALSFYMAWICQYVLLYPYLVHYVEDWVFKPFNPDKNYIQEMALELYEKGLLQRNFEACSFSLYWSYRYGFELNKNYVNDAIDSGDCVFLTMALLCKKRIADKKSLASLRSYAGTLKSDIDRYWLFVYEALPASSLSGDLANLKRNGVSFAM